MTVRRRTIWQGVVALVLGAGAVLHAQAPARLNHEEMEQLVARVQLQALIKLPAALGWD